MKSTQFGWVFLIILIIAYSAIFYWQFDRTYLIIIGFVFIIVFLLFYKLTITVDDNNVSFSMGIGLINRKYALNDIVHCKPVTYFPLGWGVRLRPGIILFNVSGRNAIELKIREKSKRVWIGTQSPIKISEYINTKLSGANS